MTGENWVIPLTGNPNSRHMLAFQAKCQPQQTQSARARRYATDNSQLLKTVTMKLARLAAGLNMCRPAKTKGENEGRHGGSHGLDQALEGISAESDFFCQRGHGKDQQIDEENSELARNRPEGDDQSAAKNQRQNADQQHPPAQRGAQAKLALPAGTDDQTHVTDGFALAIEYPAHRGEAHHQRERAKRCARRGEPTHRSQGRWLREPKCSGR